MGFEIEKEKWVSNGFCWEDETSNYQLDSICCCVIFNVMNYASSSIQ